MLVWSQHVLYGLPKWFSRSDHNASLVGFYVRLDLDLTEWKNNIVTEDDTPGYIVKDGKMLFFYDIFIPGLVVHVRKILPSLFFPPTNLQPHSVGIPHPLLKLWTEMLATCEKNISHLHSHFTPTINTEL